MKKILVVSDAHIHDRADEIPSELVNVMNRNKPYDYVLYAGDLTDPDVMDLIKEYSNNSYFVQGNMDYLDLPNHVVVNIEGFNVGVIHGHQVYPRGNIEKLTLIAKRLNASVLISGHTHIPFIKYYKDVLHINPGSCTGAWGGATSWTNPSIMIMYVKNNEVLIEHYILTKGKLSLTKYLAKYSGTEWSIVQL